MSASESSFEAGQDLTEGANRDESGEQRFDWKVFTKLCLYQISCLHTRHRYFL